MRSLVWTTPLLALALTLVGCSDDPKLVDRPTFLKILPEQISFGDVPVGERITRTILVRAGDDPVFLAIESTGLPNCFTFTPQIIDLAPRQATDVEVAFTPTEAGFVEGILGFRSSSGLEGEVQLDGQGVVSEPGGLKFDEVLNFGDVRMGRAATLPLSFENSTNETIAVGISGDEQGEFRPEEDRFELAPGERRTLSVTFSPRARGARTWVFAIEGCPACNNPPIVASGRGVAMELRASPDRVEFERLPTGYAEAREQSVTIENTGDLEVELGDVFTAGNGFSVVWDELPPLLAAGDRATVEVSFWRSVRGESEGSLLVEDMEGARLLDVPLVGSVGGPRLRAVPGTVNFGRQYVGMTATAEVLVENVGDPADVAIVEMTVEGDDRASFSLDPSWRAPGDALVGSTTVKFSPQRIGSFSAELVVYTDFADQPELRIPLSGTASGPAGDECGLYFFGQAFVDDDGSVHNPQDRRRIIINNVGRVPCVTWDFRIDDSASFDLSAPQGITTFAPGDWIDVEYVFQMPPGRIVQSYLRFETQFGPRELLIAGSR